MLSVGRRTVNLRVPLFLAIAVLAVLVAVGSTSLAVLVGGGVPGGGGGGGSGILGCEKHMANSVLV